MSGLWTVLCVFCSPCVPCDPVSGVLIIVNINSFAIDIHGSANLNQHPNTTNPMCSCLAAISNIAVQSFCRRAGHGNPAPSP